MSSRTRVLENTSRSANELILSSMMICVEYYRAHPAEIADRLVELDEEWDIERVLEAASSAFSLFGLLLGIAGDRRWLLLPFVVQGFFLQHAIQGWCPPLPIFRRLGIRTVEEIETERYALKALRGDLKNLSTENLLEVGVESKAKELTMQELH